MEKEIFSIDVGRAALRMAMSETRDDEDRLKANYAKEGFRTAAVNFGGEFLPSVTKIVERAMVAAERQHIVSDSHVGAGTVAGAAHEALSQVIAKASGFNVGGKVGIARYGEHVCVAIFMSVGVLNLNEMAIGLAHRTLAGVD